MITRRPFVVCPSLAVHTFDLFSNTAEQNLRNLTGSNNSTSSTKFVFFGPIGKTRWPPRHLIGWVIFDFFSKIVELNSTKIERKQELNVLYTQRPLPRLCYWPDRKKKPTRWPTRSLIGWDIFDFFAVTAERNLWKLDIKQDLNILYQVCVFWADRKKPQQDGHFRLLSGTAEQNFPKLKLDMKQELNLLYQVCVFWSIRKTRWLPRLLIGWDIFDFFSGTPEFVEIWKEAKS